MSQATFRESLALLRTRRFGTFWFASLLSSIGTWAQQVAQPWLLLTLGATPTLVGLDAFAMSAPVWLLTLPGGILADRADRRRVIAGFQSIQMLCPLVIVGLLLAGTIQPWMIVLLSVVVGITDALSMPSFASIVPSIVERSQIGTGIALNATQFNLSRIAGPALAGVLMAGVGAIGCFVASAISYVPFIGIALWALPRGRPVLAPGDRFDLRHPFGGARTILGDPYLRGALLTALFSSLLCGSLVTFSPVLVREAWHGSAGQFSVVVAAFGAGGLLGAIALLGVDARRDRRRLASRAAAVLGLLLAAISFVPWFDAMVGLMVAAGASMVVANTSANTLVQSGATEALRGQAVSLFMLVMRGGIALGGLATGLCATHFGIRGTLLADGLLALAAQALVARAWGRAPAPSLAPASAPLPT